MAFRRPGLLFGAKARGFDVDGLFQVAKLQPGELLFLQSPLALCRAAKRSAWVGVVLED